MSRSVEIIYSALFVLCSSDQYFNFFFFFWGVKREIFRDRIEKFVILTCVLVSLELLFMEFRFSFLHIAAGQCILFVCLLLLLFMGHVDVVVVG